MHSFPIASRQSEGGDWARGTNGMVHTAELQEALGPRKLWNPKQRCG